MGMHRARRPVETVKDLDLGARPSQGDLRPFPVPSEMQMFYLVFSRKEDTSHQKEKRKKKQLEEIIVEQELFET